MLASTIFAFLFTILPFASGSKHGSLRRRNHGELAQRGRSDVEIHKRSFDNARFTYYDVGMGACGQNSSPGDFIVALNVAQYGGGYPGPECFKSITITSGGKTAQATIMDECMGCPYGGLDFSVGLFNYFGGDGVIYGSWWFNDGSNQPTTTSSSSWTPEPTPTSTWTPPTTTSYSTTSTTPTPTPTPTTSETTTSTYSTTSTFSTTSTSSVISSTSVTSAAAVPTSTSVVGAPESGNLLVINEALVQLGALLTAQQGN